MDTQGGIIYLTKVTDFLLSCRQGGASRIPFPQNAGGLLFETQQDALNYAGGIAQDSRDWLAAQRSGFGKSYIEGHGELVLTFSSGFRSGNYKLIFRAVPSGRAELADLVQSDVSHFIRACEGPTPDGKRDLVLVRIGDLSESAENVVSPAVGVASRVWLEADQEGVECFRNVAVPVTLQHPSQVVGGFGKGEIGILDPAFGISSELQRCGADGLVEGVFQIVERGISDVTKSVRREGCELDFVEQVPSFFIVIGDRCIWLCFEEGDFTGAKFIDVSFRAFAQ